MASETTETGRVFYVIDGDTVAYTDVPSNVDYATWTEHRAEVQGGYELWYVSDHEGMTIDAEEFGPIATYEVGDEWYDGVGNWIITKVEVREGHEGDPVEYVTTHDWEGVMTVEKVEDWTACVEDMNMTRVTEPSLDERLALWREAFPAFPGLDGIEG